MALCEDRMVLIDKNGDFADILKNPQRQLFVCDRRNNWAMGRINLKEREAFFLPSAMLIDRLGSDKPSSLSAAPKSSSLESGSLVPRGFLQAVQIVSVAIFLVWHT
jgi:hypothetical protein